MKRTLWKKALTFALSAALAVSVGSVAFADETGTPENTNEIIATSEPTGEPVSDPVAKIGDDGYASLKEAVQNVTEGETIVLQKDVADGEGIGVFENENFAKKFTIDFNNHSYTVTSAPVGSTGTVNQAFHLEKGYTITLKNGTIGTTTNEVWMLLQNYCDLTLDNMVLNYSSYALSNNHGNITIRNSTINATGTNGVALDVYSFGNYSGANVTIENSIINGNIEVGYGSKEDKSDADTSNLGLTIKSGTINGNIIKSGVATPVLLKEKISIQGGTFSDPSALAYAANGANVNVALSADYNGDVVIPEGVTASVNLNGKTWTVPDDCGINVKGEFTVQDTVGSGVITSSKTPIQVEGGKLILNSGKIESTGNYGVYVKNGGRAVVNGGEVHSKYAPLSGNNTTGNMNFEVNGGVLTADYGPAIYMPGQVELKITGGTLDGGISLRMGQVTISGGTIKNEIALNDADPIEKYYDYSGNYWLTDAIFVSGGTYTSSDAQYGNSLNLSITGGEFISTNGHAVAIYNNGVLEQTANLNISGGTFKSANGKDAVKTYSTSDMAAMIPNYKADFQKVQNTTNVLLTGGQFSTDVQTYCAKGYTGNVKVGGYYLVHKHDSNIEKTPAVAPTCTEAGSTAEMSCSVCGTVMVESKPVPPTGHNLKLEDVVKATTEAPGHQAYYVCQKDNNEWFWDAEGKELIKNHDDVVIPKLPASVETPKHTVVVPEAPKVDESAKPSEEAKKVANALLVDQEAVALNGVALAQQLEDDGKSMKEAEQKLADVRAEGDTILLVVKPYVEVKPTTTVTSEDGKVQQVNLEITMKYDLQATIPGKKTVDLAKGEPMTKIAAPTTITVPVPENFATQEAYVRHDARANGYGIQYYSTKLTDGKFEFTVPAEHGFSPFTLMSNASVTVKLDGKDYTYTSLDVVNGTALPALSKNNYLFKGWKFEGIANQHFNMTAWLFEELLDKNAVVVGSSVFEGPLSEHPEIEEAKKNGTWGVDENKPAATAKPAAAAAVTPVRSSIPKTSDDSNLMLWVCLMGIAALGLGGAVYMKKRNHQ